MMATVVPITINRMLYPMVFLVIVQAQTDLARKAQLEGLSIDKKTISLIENEKRGFQDYEIICFAKAMNIPTSYILDGPPENEEKSEDKSEN